MGCKLNALILMFLVVSGWSLILSSPVSNICDPYINKSKGQTALLHQTATRLLDHYTQQNSINTNYIPDEVPTSAVTGSNTSEKLQDIFTKNALFQLHLLKTEEYQEDLLPEESFASFNSILNEVKATLTNQGLVIEKILTCVDPMALVPTSPAPLNVNHSTDYPKKAYGYGVISRLKEWLNEVKKELKVKGKNTTGI